LVEGSALEIVRATAVADAGGGNQALTVIRGEEGTTPVAFTTAAKIECRFTAASAQAALGGILPAGAIVLMDWLVPPPGFELVTYEDIFTSGDGMTDTVQQITGQKLGLQPLPFGSTPMPGSDVAPIGDKVYFFGLEDTANFFGGIPIFAALHPLTRSGSALGTPESAFPGIGYTQADSCCDGVGALIFAHAASQADPSKLLKYAITGNDWSLTSAAPVAMTGGIDLVVHSDDGYVYVIAGAAGSTTSFQRYSIVGDSWTDLSASLPASLSGQAMAGGACIDRANGVIYYLDKSNFGGLSRFYSYNIGTATWAELTADGTTVAGMQYPRLAFAWDSWVYTVHDGASSSGVVSVYDVLGDAWSTEPVNSEVGGSTRSASALVFLISAPRYDDSNNIYQMRKL
jgi:hypothetical protein